MDNLSKLKKKEIVKKLLEDDNIFGNFGPFGTESYLNFIDRIVDLSTLKSTDHRYSTARGDVTKHTIHNEDWELQYLFDEILEVTNHDDRFKNFIETSVHPEVRTSKSETEKFVTLINTCLIDTNFGLVVSDIVDGDNVYELLKIGFIEDSSMISEFKNGIPFFTTDDRSGEIDSPIFPRFTLWRDNWNDYGYTTLFNLYFFNKNEEKTSIKTVKILHESEITSNLPEQFNQLPTAFCSLGENVEYYEQFRKMFPEKYRSILHALNDIILFPGIEEKFTHSEGFKKSLLRFSDAEKAYKEARKRLLGYEIDNSFKFSFTCKLKEADSSHTGLFDFTEKDIIPNRIYAIVGKNGTGKTQYLSKLAMSLSGPIKIDEENKAVGFSPVRPLFSKVIAVSYSVFDTFPRPKPSRSYNYIYCGLRGIEKSLTKGIRIKLRSSLSKIESKNLEIKWWSIIKILIPEVFENLESQYLSVGYKNELALLDNLSSGQKMLVSIISEIIANIRQESLILFDEPEMHLHPNAISHLIRAIHELLEEFDSYAIIATHSPIIIQEVPSRSVLVFNRIENTPIVEPLMIESFGENLTTITRDIFDTREVTSTYKEVLEKMAKNHSFEEILQLFDDKLSINAKIYLKTCYSNS